MVGDRRRLRGDADARRSRCRRARRRCPSRRAGTSRTAGRTRATTRTWRSTTARGYKSIPGSIAKPAEGNGIDGVAGGLQAGHVRPVGLRGQDGLAALPLQDRRRRSRATRTRPTPPGIFVDEIKLTNGTQTVFTDGAENGANGWTATGFSIVGATLDEALRHTTTSPPTGPTRRSTSTCRPGRTTSASRTGPDWVEHFPYQNGLLVSYWDTSYSDNNESQHPGQGEILPIDANPTAIYRLDGLPWRGRDPDLRRAVRPGEVGLVHAARAGDGPRPTSAARRRSRCSTTGASTGIRRCRTSA